MTSTERAPAWSRVDPRNWTLTWKLVVVGLVPTLLALALGAMRISDQATIAADLGTSNDLLVVREQVAEAADALRLERDRAALFVGANRIAGRGALTAGFGATDAEIAEIRGTLGDTVLEPATAEALAGADEGIADLAAIRTDVTGDSDAPAADVVARYSTVIGRIDALDRALLRRLGIPEVAGLASALGATVEAAEQLARQHTVLGAAIRAGQLRPTDTATVGTTVVAFARAHAGYQDSLTPAQAERFGSFLANPAVTRLALVRGAILATPQDRPVIVAPADWDAAYVESQAAVDTAGDAVFTDLRTATLAAEERAANLAGIASVVLLLGLLVAVTVMTLMARALIRSLRVLRSSALDVAERKLPQAVASMRAGEAPDATIDPVPLSGRDEIGQVARAFDAVHGQAVRLAVDQAALQSNVSSMFVNLSRRSQALVERQLQLIEQLESNEQDPDQLSNLFQLDHLATRMRRNSENLLVLAGTELAKRSVAPVPIVDVLRAAVSEIEQYRRIVVQAPPTATVVGRAASDLVHLLAELLDNATNFSPPDSQVVVSTTSAADGSVLVEIADRGVGMVDDELSEANQRLGGPTAVDVSASRRMGLFVVGRLAARHGIGVRLGTSSAGAGSPAGGLTASVTVPAYLVPSIEPGTPQRTSASTPAVDASIVPSQRFDGHRGFDPNGSFDPNGNGRVGSLSALVAGTEGPIAPADPFERTDSPSRGDDGVQQQPQPVNGLAARADLPERDAPAERVPGARRTTVRAFALPEPAVRAGNGVEPPPDDLTEVPPATARDDGAPVTGRARRTAAHAGPPDGSGAFPEASVGPGGPPPNPPPSSTPSPSTPNPPPSSRPVDAERGADGLFAPSVPVVAEHDATRPARPSVPELAAPTQFDLGEATPIFEEIASAWFRSNRPVPVEWEAEESPADRTADQPPAAPPAPAAAPWESTAPWERAATWETEPPAEALPAHAPDSPTPVDDDTAVPVSAARGFAGDADEGWRAATGIENGGDRSEELTAAGLPKRRPRARLVPGSAGTSALAAPLGPSRSAEDVRGRLSSYQQGVRQGRESRLRRDTRYDGSFPPGNDLGQTAPAGTHNEGDA